MAIVRSMQALTGLSAGKSLALALWSVVVLHALWLIGPWPHPPVVSHLATAAVAFLAVLCMRWRGLRLPLRERDSWRWFGAAALVWSAGPVAEVFFQGSGRALSLNLSPATVIFIVSGLPILLALSSTRDTESTRLVFLIDAALGATALLLLAVLLFGMSASADGIAATLTGVFTGESLLLGLASLARLLTWSTLEERRRIRLFSAVVWMYIAIESGMGYASARMGLRAGTPLDLLWSLPFVFAGLQALRLPMTEKPRQGVRRLNRAGQMLDTLSPVFISAAIFGLAASIVGRYPLLALASVFVLLLLQSLHAGLVQMNFRAGQYLLLERESELEQANAALERLSHEDSLTGVANRRRFDAAYEASWKRAVRRSDPFAVLMIDLDHFKAVNDRYGHAYGDQCLIEIARILGEQARRPEDLLARYGGEEFVLMLPATEREGAAIVAERLRRAVHARHLVHEDSPFDQRVTISIGVGFCRPAPGMDHNLLVAVADKALYEAKRRGRNRVCTLSPGEELPEG
ncbi:MAG: GGDEF domain-containing protein [Terracidiphilus sp.]